MMIIITYEHLGEHKVKRIPRKKIKVIQYEPLFDNVKVVLESGAYYNFHFVKSIEILEV